MASSVALTFDDLFVDSWCAARRVFDAFGARVTFCVARLHLATPEQIEGLRQLQADGHEIAFHSRAHRRPEKYIAKHGLERWLAEEIDAGVAEHRAQGFAAKSFASPFHGYTPESLAATSTRFDVTRAGGPRGLAEDAVPNRIYRRLGPDKAVDNIGFCDFQHAAFPGWDWQMGLLDRIAETGGTGVFTGHDIRAGKSGKGAYSTRRQMRRFLQAAQDRGVGFVTLSEVGKAG